MDKKIVFFGLFVVAIYGLVLFLSDFLKVVEVLSSFNFIFFFCAIFLTLIAYFIRFLKWSYFLKNVKVNLNFGESLFVFFSGLMMTIVPGRVGEVWRAWLIRDIKKESLLKVIPVVVVERITDLLGLCLLATFGILFYSQGIIILVIVLIGFLLFSFVMQSDFFWNKGFFILKKLFGSKVENFDSMKYGFRQILSIKTIFLTTLISSIAWFFECLALFVLINYFIQFGLFESIFIFSFASVAGAISMIPGGLGIAEGTIVGLLTLFSVPLVLASAVSVLVRFATLWFGVLLGALTYFGFKKRFLK